MDLFNVEKFNELSEPEKVVSLAATVKLFHGRRNFYLQL